MDSGKIRTTYITIISPLMLGLVIALAGEQFIEGFSDGWVGFVGTCSGIISTAFIMVFIMQKTNTANQKIQENSNIAKLVAEYCLAATESFYSHRQVHFDLSHQQDDPQNKILHKQNEKIDREKFEAEYYKAKIFYYELEIRLKNLVHASDILDMLNVIQKTCLDTNLDKDKFEKMTEDLRSLTAKFIH